MTTTMIFSICYDAINTSPCEWSRTEKKVRHEPTLANLKLKLRRLPKKTKKVYIFWGFHCSHPFQLSLVQASEKSAD